MEVVIKQSGDKFDCVVYRTAYDDSYVYSNQFLRTFHAGSCGFRSFYGGVKKRLGRSRIALWQFWKHSAGLAFCADALFIGAGICALAIPVFFDGDECVAGAFGGDSCIFTCKKTIRIGTCRVAFCGSVAAVTLQQPTHLFQHLRISVDIHHDPFAWDHGCIGDHESMENLYRCGGFDSLM